MASRAFLQRFLVFLGYPAWSPLEGRRFEMLFHVPGEGMRWYKGTIIWGGNGQVEVSFDDNTSELFTYPELVVLMEAREIRRITM
jgi:hypothetical protein